MLLTVKIKRITVLRGRGTDQISFHLDAASPFPIMGYPPHFTIETQADYAETWLASIGLEVKDVHNTKPGTRNRQTGIVEGIIRGEPYITDYELIICD